MTQTPAPDTEPATGPHPAVRALLYVLLRLILPAAIGATVGAFLTPTEAGIAAICLGGLWLIWAAARP